MIKIYGEDIVINNEEFYEAMDDADVDEFIEWMFRDGHIDKRFFSKPTDRSVMEETYIDSLNKLRQGYYQLSKEDQEIVNLLAKKVVI